VLFGEVIPEFPPLCCPRCKGPLDSGAEQYACVPCQSIYPIVLGIPDFRVFPDPYISVQDDYRKAEYLVDHSAGLNFEGMLRLYWKITPHVEEDRAARFIRNALALADKGRARLREIERLSDEQGGLGSQAALEIGCGTGGFLVAAAGRFQQVVGIDIAFRWLVVARKRLVEAGLEMPLICACAEHLPFMTFDNDGFDLIIAEDVLDHVEDQAAALAECHRVARRDGALFMVTPNRFSLAPEPHVRVWGVGFLPRRWMDRYVKMVKGISYEHLRVPSFPELKGLLEKSAFGDYRILLPSVAAEEIKNFSAFERVQVAVYDLIRRTPLARFVLYLFGPFFHVICYARKVSSRGE
jgi:ubiquinone/menaquinone biosynthesis C-methylase UbiE/uncharacterized protein YbaR (Trm112 family)